jgi:REP element-mobilizing transposase RayT
MTDHPLRLDPRLYRGVRQYFLTICCHKHRSLLDDQEARELVVSTLRSTSDTLQFAVIAYCLMPDHIHVVCEALSDDCDL